jgi:cell division protein FtsQ
MRSFDPVRWFRKFKASGTYHAAVGLIASGERVAARRLARFAMRGSAVGMLAAVVGYGLLAGDHLSDPSSGTRGLPAQISSYFGYAAEDVRIKGLQRKRPETVMNAIGVKPGGSLLGFDPMHARRILLNLDWVKHASVRVVAANRLEVEIVEREPFAVWQRDGLYFVIDREGSAMASFDARKFAGLMLISGDGAQTHVLQLVNQLEVWPGLKSRVKAAARSGNRRWTLHFDGGRRALLPEAGVDAAMARLADLVDRHPVLDSGIQEIDLRTAGKVSLVPFETTGDEARDKLAASTR